MKIIYFFSFVLYSISSTNIIKEELNTTNKQIKIKSLVTKIILDNKLPKPTAWKIEEFSNSFQEKEVVEYLFDDKEYMEFYSFYFEPSDKDNIEFNQINKNTYYKEKYLKKMKENDEKSLNDLKNLNIDINKEIDFKNITELMEEYKLKILNITSDDEEVFKNIYYEYFHSIFYFYYKIIKTKKFLNKVEQSDFKNFKKIYYSSIPFNKKIKTFKDHPVLYGYYKAWVDHCPISISPNIIWQLILNGLKRLINENSEGLRFRFVNFVNKKTLKLVKIKESPEIEREDWEEFFDDISKQIKENMKDNIYDNIILNFTTNTKDLLLVQQISSMSMFQKYFDYELNIHVTCGFPYIELEGEIEDWELILNKIQNFKNLGVDNWIKVIEKILKKIIDSKKGKIDIQFWKNLIMYREAGRQFFFGCGAKKVPIIGLTGWITNFFPYTNKGKYLYNLETDSIYKDSDIFESDKNLLSEINETPMKLKLIEGKEEMNFNLTIYSGILGVSQDPETFLVKPELGFLITEEKKNIVEEDEDEDEDEDDLLNNFENSTNLNITDL